MKLQIAAINHIHPQLGGGGGGQGVKKGSQGLTHTHIVKEETSQFHLKRPHFAALLYRRRKPSIACDEAARACLRSSGFI